MSSTAVYYDRRWKCEDAMGAAPNSERVNRVTDAVVRLVGNRTSAMLLDVGCGNGWILKQIADVVPPGVALYGLEPSSVGVANTSRRVPHAQIIHGVLGVQTFDDKFDIIVCSEVVEHVENQAHFFETLWAEMKTEGLLILTTPNGRFRRRYFSSPSSTAVPQPVEQWMTQSDLIDRCSSRFDIVHLNTFDAEFVARDSAVLSVLKKCVTRSPGGWHVWHVVERLLCRTERGLYHFLIARARVL